MSTSESPLTLFDRVRKDFPILERQVHGKRLVFLDSAASSQKPAQVLQAMDSYYRSCNANIHRGIYTIAEEATALYEGARERIARFINAGHARELIFTRNTTESINLAAYAWGRKNLKSGDVIILTEMEHHSNLVPWQVLAAELGVRLEFIPVLPDGLLDLEAYRRLLEKKPRLVAFTHMSNVLGTINPVRQMTAQAHDAGALVLVDGAQSAPHLSIDVKELDVDFFAFSAHKMLGPTGIGALYGKEALLEAMPPFLGGGDMIKRVYLDHFQANSIPHKFEAGTPAIAEGVGFGAAVDYLNAIGMEQVSAHERALTAYAMERLAEVPLIKVLGPEASQRGGVTAFTIEGIHPHDVAQVLDADGVAVRAGHHCAMPLHDKLQLTASTRASFYVYNTREDIDQLVESLYRVIKLFS